MKASWVPTVPDGNGPAWDTGSVSTLGHSFPGPHLWPQNAPPWQATITADSNGMNAVRVCKLWRDPKLAASGVLFRNTQAQNLGAV